MLDRLRSRADSSPFTRDGAEIPAILHPHGLDRIYTVPIVARFVTRAFNKVAYYAMDRTLFGTSWMGTTIVKYPTDVWAYQEIITETRPDVIIETGTYLGGSALFMAQVCDLIGHGRVISVDVARFGDLPEHPRIQYVLGSSVGREALDRVGEGTAGSDRVMVILDSAHDCDHVLSELWAYADLVTPGCHLIVEDTCVNGNPVLPDFGPGPAEAVKIFLRERADFVVERERERFLLTQNPGGFLRRRIV